MEVLYAFCREVDDVADDESVPVDQRRRTLGQWRDDLDAAYSGVRTPVFGVNRELVQVLKQFPLRQADFHALLDGVETDLIQNRFATWDELEEYCYRVASAVGLLSMSIFGLDSPSAHSYAIHLGKALQITNILRDVRTDAEMNRIYLPIADLENFQVTQDQILKGQYSRNFLELSRFYARKAISFYALAIADLPGADKKYLVASELMGAVYWNILRRLTHISFNHWAQDGRTRLSKPHKMFLILRTWFNLQCRPDQPNYGRGHWVRSLD